MDGCRYAVCEAFEQRRLQLLRDPKGIAGYGARRTAPRPARTGEARCGDTRERLSAGKSRCKPEHDDDQHQTTDRIYPSRSHCHGTSRHLSAVIRGSPSERDDPAFAASLGRGGGDLKSASTAGVPDCGQQLPQSPRFRHRADRSSPCGGGDEAVQLGVGVGDLGGQVLVAAGHSQRPDRFHDPPSPVWGTVIRLAVNAAVAAA